MKKLNSRTFHRYLSVVVGVQLLFWAAGGLFFSWNPISKVRGEHRIRKVGPIDLSTFEVLGFNAVVSMHAPKFDSTTITKMELRALQGRPVYEFTITHPDRAKPEFVLCDAEKGVVLSPISEDMAKQIAIADFSEDVDAASVELLEGPLSSHSEYRGKELPVYRVVLDHSSGTVIYVSAARGIVTTRRNNRWRVFDFFWMLHTMDYQGRDNFNSWVLKSASIFGVVSVLSGYWLWWRSSFWHRRLKKRKGREQ